MPGGAAKSASLRSSSGRAMSLKIEISDTTARARRKRWSHGVRARLRWTLAAILAVGACAAGAFFVAGAPSVQPWLENLPRAAALIIFALTYLVIAIGKLPGFHLDRAGAALLGASLMVAFGVLSLEDAFRAIDFETITLLLGMTPIVLDIVMRLKRDPVPYLLAVAMASNIGSAATITGNPQNMIVGGLSHIRYGAFAAALWPVAAAGLVLVVLFIAIVYRREFLTRERLLTVAPRPARPHTPLVIESVFVTVAMVVFFFAGQPVAKVAIIGGALLLFTRRVKADKVYREIDWPLLVMFAGLFIVVDGAEKTVLTPDIITAVGRLHLDNIPLLSAVT